MNADICILFLCLCIAVDRVSTMTKTYYMTQEVETARMLQASSTTAVLTSAFWPKEITINLKVSSRIACAAKAISASARAFHFKEGICTLYDPGRNYPGVLYQSFVSPMDNSLEEVAKGKTTIATEDYPNHSGDDYFASLAVDGDHDSFYGSIFVVKPWWQVDLGEERLIYQIQILPRQDQDWHRFHAIEVRVGKTLVDTGDFSSYTLVCTYPNPYTIGEGHLLCSRYGGIAGRFVSIKITSEGNIHLDIVEVSVFALKK